MTVSVTGLRALADLRTAGLDERSAVAALVQAGGPVGRWAGGLATSVNAGVGLGLALARTHSLTAAELASVGGPTEAGGALALHALADARGRQAQRRGLLGALALPGILGAMTVLPVRGLGLMLGTGIDLVGAAFDWLPFGLLAVALRVTASPVGDGLLKGLARLPWGRAMAERAAAARVASLVSAGLRAGVAPAEVFGAAARLSTGPLSLAMGNTARQLRDGAALLSAMPPAERVGEPLALALSVGAGASDLPDRLAALAEREQAAVWRQGLRVVRVLAWVLVSWASWRAFASLGDLSLGEGLPGGLTLPDGADSGELQQLMREINLP